MANSLVKVFQMKYKENELKFYFYFPSLRKTKTIIFNTKKIFPF